MSSSESVRAVSLIAGSDFTGDLNKVVQISAANTVDLATAATQTAIGIVGEEVTLGVVTPVVLLQGRVKVLAGGTITVGQLLQVDATSRVVGVADINALGLNTMAIGVALTAGVVGDVIECFGMPISSAQDV